MADYHWADHGLVACITVTAMSSAEAAVRSLEPTAREAASFDEARHASWGSYELCHTMTIQTDHHVVIWEDNGHGGASGEPFLRLCSPGPAGSLFVNVNAVSNLVLGRHGSITRQFDPLFRADTDEGRGEPLAAEATLDWTMGRYLASSLALIADYTGLGEPFEQEWFESPRARQWLLPS
ncbi:hypothetical protein [Microbacterium sp. NPDC086615]|jgi:hypothetical protein|uniref:hypothetical protein n=1 Tax=Microbacterium sp. NPDC086615 TaxID=3154865 RepID=UPI003426C4E4|nr:hypothetical protein [Microbacterium sp.]